MLAITWVLRDTFLVNSVSSTTSDFPGVFTSEPRDIDGKVFGYDWRKSKSSL